jgi:hypothetical protein
MLLKVKLYGRIITFSEFDRIAEEAYEAYLKVGLRDIPAFTQEN